MKIYYFPDKRGPVYIGPANRNMVLMDTIVVDTPALISLLEERCGLFCREESFNRRMCEWFGVMKPWLDAHTDNILYQSYELNPLAMAKEMLGWRDELRMVDWDFKFEDIKSRLGALAAIEKDFRFPGLPDRLINVISEIKASKVTFTDLHILLPYKSDLLPLLLKDLIEVLAGKGVEVSIIERAADCEGKNLNIVKEILGNSAKPEALEMDLTDSSFKVMKFKSRKEEEEYFAYLPPEKDALWIIDDNKSFDNRLEASGQCATGSKNTTGSRIPELLPLLMSLYKETTDIRNIYEWLTSPFNPLPAGFRFTLAETIAVSGGYLNDECEEVKEAYINGKFEYNKEEERMPEGRRVKDERKKREEKLKLFLPYFYGLHSLADIKKGLDGLATWASQRLTYIEDPEEKENLTPQFKALTDSIINLGLLIKACKTTDIDAGKLLKWCVEVVPSITLYQYHAKKGSRQVINFSGDIAEPADYIIMMGVEGMNVGERECAFLFPGEREKIGPASKFMDPDNETRAKELLETLPFFMAKKGMVISFAEKRANESLTLHPLILRLQSAIKNWKDFVAEVNVIDYKTLELEEVNNSKFLPEFKIPSASGIKWPSVMSASSIESLIFNPFDFFFEKILRLRSAGLNNLPTLEQTKGKVAHKVIESLFSSDAETVEEYRQGLAEEYDRLLESALKETGALLQLSEHQIDFKLFRLQLEESVSNLIDIIETNNLKVVACEEPKYKKIGIAEGNDEGNDLYGILDMHLQDPSGRHVVFDFKWSGGWHYKDLLKKDRSIQLAVYSRLVKEDDENVPTAYFFMPRNELVTRYRNFKGNNVVLVDSEATERLFEKILNSVNYRKKQIESGILEGNDGGLLEELVYYSDLEEHDLLRLLEDYDDENVKNINSFSSYNIFKGL